MLDLVGLPKNSNGFRTTHTCELCGFEPKTKNKYREKQDHLVMKHFKERIDKIFPHCRPYTCPNMECEFTGKDKQALLRHYTGKHGILELYLREALLEKGIQYHMSDSAKRKSMGTEIGRRAAKEARLDNEITQIETILPDSNHQTMSSISSQAIHQMCQDSIVADTTTPTNIHLNTYHPTPTTMQPPSISTYKLPSVSTVLPSVSTVLPSVSTVLPSVTTVLPSVSTVLSGISRPTPDQIKREVEAMMASLEPCETQVVFTLPHISSMSNGSNALEDLNLDGCQVSSTTPDCLLPMPDNTMKVVLNDPGIMWGGGGPSVLVESAQTVPVQYIEDSGFVNLGDIDYDYLYPATLSTPQPSPCSSSIQERQLPFSMM